MIAYPPAHSVVSDNNFTDAEAKKAVSSGMFEDHYRLSIQDAKKFIKSKWRSG